MSLDWQAMLDLVLRPISDSEPCGEDPKYNELYEGIREEIAKTSGIGHGACDWEKVLSSSTRLLGQTSKEINIMTYACCSLAQIHGIAGLNAGLKCFSAFLQTFWDNMHPPVKKLQIRERAISWLNDRLLELRDSGKLASKERPVLGEILDVLAAFKDVVYEKFPEPPSNFKLLRSYFEELLAQVPPEAPPPLPAGVAPPAAATQAPAQVSSSAPPTTTQPPAPTHSAAPAVSRPAAAPMELPALADQASLEEMVKVLGKIAEAVRLADGSNPLGFQLRRQAAWFFCKMPPNNQGETLIMAPAEEVQASLRNMLGKASWPQLLERAEELMTRFPLWLELQYYAGTSAAMQGDSHQEILRTIMNETLRLDQRLPQLKTLKFNDGSPFATSAARGWVEQLAQQLAGGGGAAADAADDLRGELMKLGGNQFEQGLKLAQQAIEQAGNGREAFRLRLEAAAFCLEAKQHHWCHAFTLGLAEQIDRFQLQEWEPQLCGRVWGLQIQVARELREEGPHWETREHEAMRRLSLSHLTLAGQYPSKPKSPR